MIWFNDSSIEMEQIKRKQRDRLGKIEWKHSIVLLELTAVFLWLEEYSSRQRTNTPSSRIHTGNKAKLCSGILVEKTPFYQEETSSRTSFREGQPSATLSWRFEDKRREIRWDKTDWCVSSGFMDRQGCVLFAQQWKCMLCLLILLHKGSENHELHI